MLWNTEKRRTTAVSSSASKIVRTKLSYIETSSPVRIFSMIFSKRPLVPVEIMEVFSMVWYQSTEAVSGTGGMVGTGVVSSVGSGVGVIVGVMVGVAVGIGVSVGVGA